MDIDYSTLQFDLETGVFRERLQEDLTRGFLEMQERKEALPPPSYYASKIAEIVYSGAEEEIPAEMAYNLYQEVLAAVEKARMNVMGDPGESS